MLDFEAPHDPMVDEPFGRRSKPFAIYSCCFLLGIAIAKYDWPRWLGWMMTGVYIRQVDPGWIITSAMASLTEA